MSASENVARRSNFATARIRVPTALFLALLAASDASRGQGEKNTIETDEAAVAKLTAKMQSIVFPKLNFQDAKMTEVIAVLSKGSDCEIDADSAESAG